MKSLLVFLLINGLILAGMPLPTHSEGNLNAFHPKTKGDSCEMNRPYSLQRKTGDPNPVSWKLDQDSKGVLKNLEAKNPSLLGQKAGDGEWDDQGQSKEKTKKGGDSTTGLIILGVLVTALVVVVVKFADALSHVPFGGGGSC